MSDYLTRMVDRATGREPVVRPLVPVSFAPRPEGLEVPEVGHHVGVAEKLDGRSRVLNQSETEAVLGQIVPEGARNIEGKGADSFQPPAPPEDIPCLTQTASAPRATLPAEEGENDPAVPGKVRAPKNSTQNTSVHRAAAAVGFVPEGDARPSVPDEAVTVRHAEGGEPDVFQEALQQLHRRKVQKTMGLIFTEEELVHPFQPGDPTGDFTTSRAASSSTSSLQEVAGMAQALGRLSLQVPEKKSVGLEEAAPKPPTIKVSIGRVEIRASAPAAVPAETQAASAPKISLDDYLRKQPGRTR